MKRLVLTAALLAIGGLATAASAGEGDKARTATVYGRSVVWHEAKAERPYALRGEAARIQVEKPRITFHSHGRAGTSVELNRDAESNR